MLTVGHHVGSSAKELEQDSTPGRWAQDIIYRLPQRGFSVRELLSKQTGPVIFGGGGGVFSGLSRSNATACPSEVLKDGLHDCVEAIVRAASANSDISTAKR